MALLLKESIVAGASLAFLALPAQTNPYRVTTDTNAAVKEVSYCMVRFNPGPSGGTDNQHCAKYVITSGGGRVFWFDSLDGSGYGFMVPDDWQPKANGSIGVASFVYNPGNGNAPLISGSGSGTCRLTPTQASCFYSIKGKPGTTISAEAVFVE